jgi:hypothetical protein
MPSLPGFVARMGTSDSLAPFGLDYGRPSSSAYLDVGALSSSPSTCTEPTCSTRVLIHRPPPVCSRGEARASHVTGSSLWIRAASCNPAARALDSPTHAEVALVFAGAIPVDTRDNEEFRDITLRLTSSRPYASTALFACAPPQSQRVAIIRSGSSLMSGESHPAERHLRVSDSLQVVLLSDQRCVVAAGTFFSFGACHP